MSNLREQIAAKKEAEGLASCHQPAPGSGVSFIELRPDPHTRTGFPVVQLCHYTLGPNPEAGEHSPERLTLAFHTADVVILGARLGQLADLVSAHELKSVTALEPRYAGAVGRQPFVARIEIRPLGKGG